MFRTTVRSVGALLLPYAELWSSPSMRSNECCGAGPGPGLIRFCGALRLASRDDCWFSLLPPLPRAAFTACPKSFLSFRQTRRKIRNSRTLVAPEVMPVGRSCSLRLHEYWQVRLVTSRLTDGCADEHAQRVSTMAGQGGSSLQRVCPPALASTLCMVQGRQ